MWEQIIFFAKENYFSISYGITLVASIVYYRRYFDTVLKYFPILIAYTFLNELLGYFVRNYPDFSFYNDITYSAYNDILYNIYAVVSFAFFYFVYWKLIPNMTYKKWILYGSIVVLASYIISLFFQNPIDTNLYYATATGSWVLVFSVLLYFLNNYKNKEKIMQPNNLMFWVSLALLTFYSVLPILFLIGYNDVETWENYNLKTVLRVFIIIMYSLLTIGFLKGRRQQFR